MFKWLSRLDDHFPIRYSVWALCAIGLIASLMAWHQMGTSLWLIVVFLVLRQPSRRFCRAFCLERDAFDGHNKILFIHSCSHRLGRL